MTGRLDDFRNPRDGGTERAIWVAAALSLLVHAALLWGLPRLRLPSLDQPAWSDANRSLSVRLVPLTPPPVPPSPARRTRPPLPLPVQPPAAARPRPVPPVTALKPPAPTIPAPARPAIEGDLSSYIEAKRRARGEPAPAAPAPSVPVAPSVEGDEARRDRIAAANLALPQAPAFGYDPRRQGGAFQLQRVGFDDAEFIFYGWDREARRNMARLVEVRKGNDSDIRIAVVRRIIAIIRDYEQGDFLWESSRLGRSLTLSARARDNAGLEEFMMQEFFNDPRRTW
ncbi:MAG: hypothetical protein HY322_16515 [Betaproteobacteria bacterium]|nr:hypothetical protein [Betaproteobacteria bacterium]